jgi:hypothetical protein
MKSDK